MFTFALGFGYPFAVWAISQAVFSHQANGSLIVNEKGEVIGSELIGQHFSSPGYFYGRPSSAGNGYDAAASSGSNLGPTSRKLIDRISDNVSALGSDDQKLIIPADLVTTSASGLDPHISPAAAEFQITRIAAERNVSVNEVKILVERFTLGRDFGFFGEHRVNVLLLNLEMDKIWPNIAKKESSLQ